MGVNVFLLTANEHPPLPGFFGQGCDEPRQSCTVLALPFNFVTLLTYATDHLGAGRGGAVGRGLGRGLALVIGP